jgi:hypothetical protein
MLQEAWYICLTLNQSFQECPDSTLSYICVSSCRFRLQSTVHADRCHFRPRKFINVVCVLWCLQLTILCCIFQVSAVSCVRTLEHCALFHQHGVSTQHLKYVPCCRILIDCFVCTVSTLQRTLNTYFLLRMWFCSSFQSACLNLTWPSSGHEYTSFIAQTAY